MKRPLAVSAIGLLVALLVASPLLAQGPPGHRGGGPPFCQSGQGHPVHGWGWCVAKGWAPAPAYAVPVFAPGWDVIFWEDAGFRHSRPIRQDRWMDHRELRGILGPEVMVRLETHSGPHGRRTELRGRWVRGGGSDGMVLEVMVGSTSLAYLQDLSLDGWVDRVYLRPW